MLCPVVFNDLGLKWVLMVEESCLSHLFVFGVGLSVVGIGVYAYSATWCEYAGDFDVFGLH